MDSNNYSKLYTNDSNPDEESSSDDEYYRQNECKYIDCVGNVINKLKQNNCIFASSIIDTNKIKYSLTQTKITSNVNLNARFKRFKREKLSRKYNEYNLNEKKKILYILIKDKCILFEPPNNYNTFPSTKQYTQLWYFNSTVSSIIPRLNYNDGRNALCRLGSHTNLTTKQKLLTQNINGNSLFC